MSETTVRLSTTRRGRFRVDVERAVEAAGCSLCFTGYGSNIEAALIDAIENMVVDHVASLELEGTTAASGGS